MDNQLNIGHLNMVSFVNSVVSQVFNAIHCGWSVDVRFYVLFSGFSVIAGQWMVANERLCTMESR